jgi:glycerophosphoryl diester phosphodiesterase
VVAIHDATLARTAGLDAAVSQMTLADIQKLDAGSWKSPAYAGQKVPTLSQVLECVPAGKKLVIEIKGQEPELVPAMARTLHAGCLAMSQIVLIAFNADQLKQAKALLPGTTTLFLASAPKQGEDVQAVLGKIIDRAAEAGFDGLNLSRNWLWDQAMVDRIHREGLSCWVWTVNDESLALNLARYGVDGLTTDKPGSIRQYLMTYRAALTSR